MVELISKKLDIFREWEQDPRYKNLSLEQRAIVAGNFFDKNVGNQDKWSSLTDDIQKKTRQNFIDAQLEVEDPVKEPGVRPPGIYEEKPTFIQRAVDYLGLSPEEKPPSTIAKAQIEMEAKQEGLNVKDYKKKVLGHPSTGDIGEAFFKGAARGLTTELPSMLGGATEFVGNKSSFETLEKSGKSVKEWGAKKGKEWFGDEPTGGPEYVVYQGAKMLAPSMIPSGAINLGLRSLMGIGRVVKAAKLAGNTAEGLALMERAKKMAETANNIASATTAGGFGLNQAQQTVDTANQRADKLEAKGLTEEAAKMREKAKGFTPWVTGGIEAAGEYLGTKYLSKLFGLDEAEVIKKIDKNFAKDFLKTLGVEVGTEMGQQGGEAGAEKISGIRPEAHPISEALDVVGPTVFMTILTGGLGAGINVDTGERKTQNKNKPATKPTPTQVIDFIDTGMTTGKTPQGQPFAPLAATELIKKAHAEGVIGTAELEDLKEKHPTLKTQINDIATEVATNKVRQITELSDQKNESLKNKREAILKLVETNLNKNSEEKGALTVDQAKTLKLNPDIVELGISDELDALIQNKLKNDEAIVKKITESKEVKPPVSMASDERKSIIDKLGPETETRFGKVKDLSDEDLITVSRETSKAAVNAEGVKSAVGEAEVNPQETTKTTETAEQPAQKGKQPWEMTREEFRHSSKFQTTGSDIRVHLPNGKTSLSPGSRSIPVALDRTHLPEVKTAIQEGKLNQEEYNKIHGPDYGEWGSEEFNKNFQLEKTNEPTTFATGDRVQFTNSKGEKVPGTLIKTVGKTTSIKGDDGKLYVVSPDKVEATEQPKVKTVKPTTPIKFDSEKHSLSQWVKLKGGIKETSMPGEVRRLRGQPGGIFLFNNNTGKTFDDLAQQAKAEGFPVEDIRTFIDTLESDLTHKTTGDKIFSVRKQNLFDEKKLTEEESQYWEEKSQVERILRDEEGIDEGTIREAQSSLKEDIQNETNSELESEGYPPQEIRATADELGDWFDDQSEADRIAKEQEAERLVAEEERAQSEKAETPEDTAERLKTEEEKPTEKEFSLTKEKQTIPYSPSLSIKNIESLPKGTGSNYLLAIKGERGDLVAKSWKRKPPEKMAGNEVLIDFTKEEPKQPSLIETQRKVPTTGIRSKGSPVSTEEMPLVSKPKEAEAKKAQKELPTEEKEIPLFKRGEEGKGIRKVDIENSINPILDNLKIKPKVTVVESYNELPQDFKTYFESQGGGIPEGVIDPKNGNIYLVAENLPSIQRAQTTLFHELYGHYGAIELFGDQFIPFLNKIYLSYGPKGLKDIAKLYGSDLNTKQGRMEAAAEKLALMAETNEKPAILQQIYQFIRNWLREMGFDLKLTDQDLRDIISKKIKPYLEGKKGFGEARENLRGEGLLPMASRKPTDLDKEKESGKILPMTSKKGPGEIPAKETPQPEAGINDFQERIIAAQDLRDEAKEQGYRIGVNSDGSVTLYHGTSPENANTIKSSGQIERQAFLSPNKSGAEYYGKTKNKSGEILSINVDARDIEYSTGTGEVYAPDGLINVDGIWQSPKRTTKETPMSEGGKDYWEIKSPEGEPIKEFYVRGGFGKSLEPVNYSGTLYHSATWDGLIDLLEHFAPFEKINFATPRKSNREFGSRGLVLVLEVKNKNGEYSPVDADSGKFFGWDEFRTIFFSQKEFLESLKEIRLTKETYEKLLKFKNSSDEEEKYFYKVILPKIKNKINVTKEGNFIQLPNLSRLSEVGGQEARQEEDFLNKPMFSRKDETPEEWAERILEEAKVAATPKAVKDTIKLDSDFQKNYSDFQKAANPENPKSVDPRKELTPDELNNWIKSEWDALAKTAASMKPKNLPHASILEKLLASPEFYQHPVLKKLVDHALERNNLFYDNLNYLNAADDPFQPYPSVTEATKALALNGVSKRSFYLFGKTSNDYKLFQEIIDQGDIEEKNPKIFEEELRKGLPKFIEIALEKHGMSKQEIQKYKQNGVPDDVINTWKLHRESYDKTIDKLLAPLEELQAKYDGAKIPSPDFIKITDESGKEVTLNLKEAIADMKKWRGSYAPRMRETGDWVVSGYKTLGIEKERVLYRKNSAWNAERLANKLRSQGFIVSEPVKSPPISERTYQIIKVMETAKFIEQAAKRTDSESFDAKAKFLEGLFETAADMFRERGFRSHMIHRQRGGDVVKGYIEDPNERFVRYISNVSAGLAKAETAKKMVLSFFGEYDAMGKRIGGVDQHKETNVYDVGSRYIEEQLRNSDAGDRFIGLVKSIATFKYLGFNPRSLAVNSTAMVTTVPASLHEYAGEGKIGFNRIGLELGKALQQYARRMVGKEISLSKEEKSFLDEIEQRHYDKPQYAQDASGTIRGAYGRTWSNAMSAAMYAFGKEEQLMRGATMLAGFRIARKAGFSFDEAEKKGQLASNRAHGIYGKATLPIYAQGNEIGDKFVKLFYSYMKFPHTYLQTLYDLGMRKKNIKAFVWQLAAPIVLGGTAAIPFKDLMFGFISSIMKLLDDDRDPEKMVWDGVREELGPTAERAGRLGLTGLAGVDLSGSLSIGVGIPRNAYELFGVAGGVTRDLAEGYHYMFETKQPGRALEKVLPTGIANIPRAIRERITGATTSKGRRVFNDDGTPYVPSKLETGLRALGFRSSREAVLASKKWEENREVDRYKETHDEILEQYRAYSLNPSPEKEKAVNDRISEYNDKLIETGKAGEIPFITQRSLESQERNIGLYGTDPENVTTFKKNLKQVKFAHKNYDELKDKDRTAADKFDSKTKQIRKLKEEFTKVETRLEKKRKRKKEIAQDDIYSTKQKQIYFKIIDNEMESIVKYANQRFEKAMGKK